MTGLSFDGECDTIHMAYMTWIRHGILTSSDFGVFFDIRDVAGFLPGEVVKPSQLHGALLSPWRYEKVVMVVMVVIR